MAMTMDALAKELGIDPATLKPEAVSKWNGYLSEADTKYQTAQQAVEQAKREQAAINEQIQKFGITETTVAQLQASNAAMKAALDAANASGFKIDMSGIPQPKTAAAVDPVQAATERMNAGFQQMGAALRVIGKYHEVYGKPFAGDPVKLIDEAVAARMPVEQYAEQKFKFGEESARVAKANAEAHDKQVAESAIAKWKENNPTLPPTERPGLASRNPQILVKPRNDEDRRSFANMPAKSRLEASVARYRQIAKEQTA
jgi:hypothetical protein